MASGEGQLNPFTSGDAGGDHNEDFGNEYGPPLPTEEELREIEHRRLVGEATNMMLNSAKDPKLAKYMTEIAFQDVHAQWKATTTSKKKQFSKKELEEEIEARLARILGAPDKGKKHDKKRRKSTDFPGYLDSRFTSLFWKAIWENIGTRLQFSSSFHLQTDGQSEIANSVVLDLLKSYISDQKTQWERYLPLVEFAYNNTIHSSTRKAPFEIVEGAMKVPPFLSTKDKIFEADEYTRDLDTAFAKVRETLQKSQERQKKAADRHRRDLKLKENDWVLLRFEKARLRKKKGK
ncbi:hypothetical protein L7F22_037500 [Adiantum nelumboides]|nr:hypothetical protein [Adiantum nelumboides]